MNIKVAEIFGPTIQGEGPNTGKKVIFCRVIGCDFKCSWCDSKFAWKINDTTISFTPHNLALELINKCIDTNTSEVVITGGNPCLYDLRETINLLHENNIKVDIETQGSVYPQWLSLLDLLVISPKAPSSNQKDVKDDFIEWFSKQEIIPNTCIKIPVFNEADFEFVKEWYNLIKSNKKTKDIKIYINVGNTNTSEGGDISNRVLKCYRYLVDKVMESDLKDVYVMLQMHTLIWGNRQGV